MSDNDMPSETSASTVANARVEAVSQAEIDDVLGDERLSPAERMARLADLRQRILNDEHAEGEEEYAPLRLQIMDALSMLAEGGHDYDGSLRVEGENAVGRGDPLEDDTSDTSR